MTKEFIPYQQGLQLKELGFDEPCWAWWHIEDRDTRFCYSEQRSPIINSDYSWIISGGIWDSDTYPTYEEAELDCLNNLIGIIDAKIKNRR